MIQPSKLLQAGHKNHLVKNIQPAFLTAEALVASVFFAIILTGTIKIIEQQTAIYNKSILHQRIHSAIIQDSKAIRQYATMWLSENVDYEKLNEFPEDMLYMSSGNCIHFNRRGALESAYRSDSFNYNRIFPFTSEVHQNNVVIATISDKMGNNYVVRRTYVTPTNNANLETDPYTIRVKYTTELVSLDNKVTQYSFEHNMDVNLIAQYSC